MIKIKTFLLLASVIVISISCKKEGCTDPAAKNYNVEARKDDGSCVFENPQAKNDHMYTMISASGDTLLNGTVPYVDGLAQTGLDEDNNRYRLKTILVSNDGGGLISGGKVYLNTNNQPEMATIDGENNDGNAFTFQTLGINGLMYVFSQGTISIENFTKREALKSGNGNRITVKIIFDGVFVDMSEEEVSAKFSITYNN